MARGLKKFTTLFACSKSDPSRGSKITNVKLIGLAAILSAAIATLSVGAFGHPAFHSDMDRIHRLNISTAMFDTGSAWFDDEPKCRSDGRIALPCITMQQAGWMRLEV